MRDRPARIQAVPSAPGAPAVLERAAASDDDWRHRGIGRKWRVRGKRRVGRHRRQLRMRFGLARFVIFVMRATDPAHNPADRDRLCDSRGRVVRSLLGKIGRVHRRILRGREQRPAEHPMQFGARRRGGDPSNPPRVVIASGNRFGGNSHLKFDHIFVKSGLKLCQDWGKTGLRQSRKLPTWSKNYPSSSSRCGSSGVSAGGIG